MFFIDGGKFLVNDSFFIAKLKDDINKEKAILSVNSTVSLLILEVIGRKTYGIGVMYIYGPEFANCLLVNPKLFKGNISELYKQLTYREIKSIFNELSYPDAEINGQKIIFPERVLENIDYQLDKAYQGLYGEISRTISERLTMDYYRILEYKKTEKLSQAEQMALGRMVALEGIFRTILLKRLESSVEAFRKSVATHVRFLEKLKDYLDRGKLLTKQTFYKYVSNIDEETPEDFLEELADINIDDFRKEELIEDIKKDIAIFREMGAKVNTIDAGADSKLKELKKDFWSLARRDRLSSLHIMRIPWTIFIRTYHVTLYFHN
jgi:hypothetical protein